MKKNHSAGIWVVDDDEGILEVVQLLFDQEQLEARFFSDPHQMQVALDNGFRPRLVLLDVFMNGINGVDVARNLKQDELTKNIPIILLTADIDAEKKAKFAQTEGYLTKPFDIEELLAVVRGFLPKS